MNKIDRYAMLKFFLVVLALENLADLYFLINEIVSGQYTQTSLAIFAADHDINLTNIDLVGLTETGIEYI